MRLNPKHPPGRANRKARAFEPEIARLRSEGYSCESIRAALADIGVEVSLSTVQREAARRFRQPSSPVARESSSISTAESAASVSIECVRPGPAGDRRTGKQIAADFVSKRITNPLLRDRSSHEGGSH